MNKHVKATDVLGYNHIFSVLFPSTPESPDSVDIPKSRSDYWVFRALTNDGFRRLKGRHNYLDGAVDSLKKSLMVICGPTLQAEYQGFINACEQQNVVPKQRSKQVDERLRQLFLQKMKSGGSTIFFKSNSYLRTSVQNAIKYWLRNNELIVKRLESDQAILRNRFITDDGSRLTIESLGTDLSDSHNNHQTVNIVTLNKRRRLVYKPRSLSAEASFYHFINSLSKTNDLAIRPYTPWIIDRMAYGWMEYIEPLKELGPNFDSTLYAQQFGMLCALWYIAGGTDLHEENIIFSKKGVVLVDCETIFEADFSSRKSHPAISYPLVEPDAFSNSILGTLALSVLASDLNPQKENIQQIAGIAAFRRLFEKSFKQHGKSSLEVETMWETFSREVGDSITQTLELCARRSQDLQKSLSQSFGTNLQGRRLLRSTAVYGAILNNLRNNPRALQTRSKARSYIQSQLKKAPGLPTELLEDIQVIQSETAQLLNFDVPYFPRHFAKNELRTSTNFCFQYAGSLNFCSLRQRLSWLQDNSFIRSQADLALTALIPDVRLAQYVRTTPDKQKVGFYYKFGRPLNELFAELAINPEKVLNTIASEVSSEVVHANESDYAFMVMSLQEHKSMCTLVAGSYSLFNGLAGKLLYLGLYSVYKNDSAYTEIVNREILRYLDQGKNTEYIEDSKQYGPIPGYQSFIYVLKCLHAAGSLDGALPKFDYDQIFSAAPNRTPTHDLVTSLPGSILMGCSLSDQLTKSTLLDWKYQLKQVMRALIRKLENNNLEYPLGLAHGPLGVCLAASRLADTLQQPDSELKKLTLKIIKLEAASSKNKRVYSWCYGTSGRAITYSAVGAAFDKPGLVRVAKKLVSLKNRPQFHSHTMCCGSLGYIAAHLTIYSYDSPKQRFEALCDFYRSPKMLLKSQNSSDMMPSNLFYGTAGLGIVILFALRPDLVPPVWLFGQCKDQLHGSV